MTRDRTLVMEWPELDIRVECEPLAFNRECYDFLLDNLPIKGIQGHAVVTGELMYIMNLKLSTYPTFKYNDLKVEDLSMEDVGRVSIFITAGRVGSISVKYGECTENMSYPTIAQVVARDIEKLKEAGAAIWNAIYKTKDIIIVNFSVK